MNHRHTLLAFALGLGFGCSDPQPLVYPVHIGVKADEHEPVAGAQINLRGKLLGTTNLAGEIDTQLRGFEGDRLPIRLVCPEGYAPNPEDSTIILRTVQGLGGEERRPIVHSLGCQPLKRDAVVVVHAGGAGASLPVKIDGAAVGETDGLGFGHFHLRTDPGTRFEVAIDTSSNDKLMPQNPREVFQIGKKDDLFVFDQTFKLPPKPKVVHKRAKPAPKPIIPVRLR